MKKDSDIDSKKDSWYQKYGLLNTPITFDFHLDDSDIKDATSIVDGVKIISIKDCIVEFGFEDDPYKKDIVVIDTGFAGFEVPRYAFEEALKRFRLRSTEGIEELKKEMKKNES